MLPGLVGRSKTTIGPCGREESVEPGHPVVGHLDDGDELGAVLATAEPGVQLGGEEHALGVGAGPEVVGPGGRRTVRAQQGAYGPALLDRPGDRSDALHEELTAAVPLGAVGEERLPLLEAGVLAGDAEVRHAGVTAGQVRG